MGWKRKKIESAEALKTLRISPSSINNFRGCGKRWFKEYVLARSTKTSLSLVKGNVVHHVLEEMFKQRFVPAGEAFRPHMMNKAFSMFEKEWETDVNAALNAEDPMDKIEETSDNIKIHKAEAKWMIERFFTRFCDQVQEGIKIKKFANETQGYYFTRPTFKELWVDDQFQIEFNEKWKKVDSPKVPLQNPLIVGGFIDSVQKDFDNNIYLVDYKTSNKYKEALSAEYVLQLSIYAYLWFKQTGKLPAYVGIKYLKFDEMFYVKVSPDLISEAIRKIKSMRTTLIENGLDESKYVKKTSKLCDYCSFKEECMGIIND